MTGNGPAGADLAERLARVERGELVRTAIGSYARCLDEGDLDGLRRHFAPGAVFRGADGVTRRGSEAILEFFAALMTAVPRNSGARHYVTNIEVDTSLDRPSAAALFLLVVPGAPGLLRLGTYRDRFDIVDGRAVCVDKFITVDKTMRVAAAPSQG